MALLKSASDPELERLRQQELELLAKQKQVSELPKLLEKEKRDRESTMPPLADIQDRTRAKRYEEELATRGAVRNLQKAQTRSLLLFLMLLTATVALAICAGVGLAGLNGFSWHDVVLAGGSAYAVYRLVGRLRKSAPRLILKRIEALDDGEELPAR